MTSARLEDKILGETPAPEKLVPKRGDTVYRITTGRPSYTLEKARFLEQSLSDPTCTIETWLLADWTGQKFRCSMNMYVTTALEAWRRHLDEITATMPGTRKALRQAARRLVKHELLIRQARSWVSNLE